MLNRYLRAVRKVAKNPNKIKSLPDFLFEEAERVKVQVILSVISKRKKSISDVNAEFYITNETEYWRVNSLMEEKHILKQVVDEVNEDDNFLDVGANIGVYSCLIGDKIKDGNIIAVEPEPGNFKHLNENLELNDIDARTLDLALGDENRTVNLEMKGSEPGGGKHKISQDVAEDTIRVEQKRLETFLQENPHPDVMKIDVEGAELNVIKGMGEEPDIRTIFCEIHTKKIQDFGGTKEEIESELRDRSYSLERLDKNRRSNFHQGN